MVAVTLEINNIKEFRRSYFEILEEFCEEHDMNTCYPVIKSDDLKNNIPGFKFSRVREELITRLFDIDEIENVHVTFGYHPEEVILFKRAEEKSREVSGGKFLNSYLFNYFPLVGIWSYLNYKDNRDFIDKENVVRIDGISGKITKAWKDVGNHFEKIEIIPKGDETYPELSWVDLVSNYIARTLPYSSTFENEEEGINFEPIPIYDYTNEHDIYSSYEFVNSDHDDMIVPDFTHPIKGQIFYPHPIFYIVYGSSIKKDFITQTNFYERLKEVAFENGGCVKFIGLSRDIGNICDGDVMVTVNASSDQLEELETISKMNWNKEIEIVEYDEIIEKIERY